MAKRSSRGLSKKWMPEGSVRGMSPKLGRRVWKYNGQEYDSLRGLIFKSPIVDSIKKEKKKKKKVEA